MYYNKLSQNLSNQAEESLLALSFKYELTTGNRLMWRKNPSDLYRMVRESLNSDNKTLKYAAVNFLNQLSPLQSQVFIHQGIRMPQQNIHLSANKQSSSVQKFIQRIAPSPNIRKSFITRKAQNNYLVLGKSFSC